MATSSIAVESRKTGPRPTFDTRGIIGWPMTCRPHGERRCAIDNHNTGVHIDQELFARKPETHFERQRIVLCAWRPIMYGVGTEGVKSVKTRGSSKFQWEEPHTQLQISYVINPSSNPPVGKTLTTNLQPQRHLHPPTDSHGRRSPSDTIGLRSDAHRPYLPAELTNAEPNPGRTSPERYNRPSCLRTCPPRAGTSPSSTRCAQLCCCGGW